MLFISHRINYLDAEISKQVFSAADGIEFDIRDYAGEIVVQHDPYKTGQSFAEFLQFCPSEKFYIVNIKAEGIEADAIRMLEAVGIQNFFLLDCGMPAMMKLRAAGERRIAIRFSEVESKESVLLAAPFVSWVWVDCFKSGVLTNQIAAEFQTAGLRICIVSPELQGRGEEDVRNYVNHIAACGGADAVCSKSWFHGLWRN